MNFDPMELEMQQRSKKKEPRYKRFDRVIVVTDRYPAIPRGSLGMVQGGDDYYNLWVVAFDNRTGGEFHGTDIEKVTRRAAMTDEERQAETIAISQHVDAGDYQAVVELLQDENAELKAALRKLMRSVRPSDDHCNVCYRGLCGDVGHAPDCALENARRLLG